MAPRRTRRPKPSSSSSSKKTPTKSSSKPVATTTTTTITPTADQPQPQPKHRTTATHIFFYGGALSNFHKCGRSFGGARCLELLSSRLAATEAETGVAYARPPASALSTRLLASFAFSCGEQWMMALKGWWFERVGEDEGEDDVDREEEDRVGEMDGAAFQDLRRGMLQGRVPKGWDLGTPERELWASTMCRVVREGMPRRMKALGRKARGFDDAVWSVVSRLGVTAACVARAEVNLELRRFYTGCGDRRFVEGSPRDGIWGVRLHWQDGAIEDPKNWRGENRLGLCHDEAAKVTRERFGVDRDRDLDQDRGGDDEVENEIVLGVCGEGQTEMDDVEEE